MNVTTTLKINDIEIISGSVTEPEGFLSTGSHTGVKRKKNDLSIIMSETLAVASGVFTTNLVKAAPVLWCQEKVKNKIRALVVNSGNANACTGKTGIKHNELMAETLASMLGSGKDEVLVSSTGLIGTTLPIEKILNGIKNTVGSLEKSQEGAKKAAQGILTTDTFEKEIAIKINLSGKTVKIGGIAKGSGMIHPNMATMLSFVTTDADISKELLDDALKESTEDSYNMISVDGDTSTNDMTIVLANGMAQNTPITEKNEDYEKFKQALHYVNTYLAREIVRDGEGITKFIEVEVSGAKTKPDAKKIAKSVITSNLVKTAMFGADANWGRILVAAGYSGAEFDPATAKIEFSNRDDSVVTFSNGEPVMFDEDKALKILQENEVKISLALNQGKGKATAWGSDLSYEYVKINGEYRT